MLRQFLSRVAPTFIKDKYRDRRLRKQVDAEAAIPASQVFSDIYRQGVWGSVEDDHDSPFCSGPGTVNADTRRYVEYLTGFIDQFKITSLADLGCGDFRIMKQVLEQRPGLAFTGIDVVPELIEYNQQHFGRPDVRFVCLDAATAPALPAADLLTVRQVLQHLSNHQISRILSRLGAYKYALITEHLPVGDTIRHNIDKPQGQGIRVDYDSGVFITRPPFNVNATPVLEYRNDHNGKHAVIRTWLVTNPRR